MALNKKVSFLFLVICLFLIAFLLILTQERLQNSLLLEEKFTQKSIIKLVHAIESSSEYLQKIAYEYAKNDELLSFIKQKDALKVNEYFQKDTNFMNELYISYFIFFDKNKNYLYGQNYDVSSDEQLEIPQELLDYVKNNNIERFIKAKKQTFYMTIDFEKVVFTIKELKNNKQENVGYLFLARSLDSSFLSDVSNILQNYLSLIPSYSNKVANTLTFKNSNIYYDLVRIDEEMLFTYIKFYDEFDESNFYIRMNSARDFYKETRESLFLIVVAVAICLLLMVLIFYVFMNKVFTKRIMTMANTIKAIAQNQDLNTKISVSFNDEITYLAYKLNAMFVSIHNKQDEDIRRERDFLQSVLDTQQNIILITDGRDIYSTNRKFHETFGSKEQFLTSISIDEAMHESLLQIAKEYSKEHKPAKFKLIDKNIYFTFDVNRLDPHRYLICMNDVSRLNEKISHLENKASIDALTNVYNKATITDISKEMLEARSFHALIFDIDFFKKINDTYGHLIGDHVLKDLSAFVKSIISKHDFMGRIGGEEFMILLNSTNKADCINIAERIRTAVQTRLFIYEESILEITISLGCTLCSPGEDFNTIYQRADKGLYHAKQNGRNQVIYT